eukprot:Ihof_evm8s105 gene=Ihof_evmTU8s105
MKSIGVDVTSRRGSFNRRNSLNKYSLVNPATLDLQFCEENIISGEVGHKVLNWVPTRQCFEAPHRCTEGEWEKVVIPRQEGKLTASFGIKFYNPLGSPGPVVVERLFHDCPAEKAGLK